MTLYDPDHRCQYDYSAFTAVNGCTWTSGTTGADAATGGAVDLTPDQVHAKVKRYEETNPSSPGWSMADLDLAMARLRVPFENRTGQRWGDLTRASAEGKYIVLQGDSDVFGNTTCSGAFNGDHAVGVRPGLIVTRRPIDDPICRHVRYEESSVLRAYAEKLARRIGEYPGLRFGVFTNPVPVIPPVTRWKASVKAGTTFWVYRLAGDYIVERSKETTENGFTAQCSRPQEYRVHTSAKDQFPDDDYVLVQLLSGSRQGYYIGEQYAKEV